MLSDASDLTDLSSDDNYGRSTKKSQSSKKADYRLRNVLKPGRTTQYTAKALYDQIHDGDIDLDPEYQRDVVWSEIKQIGLIDSIFRNFYVPPIIFAVTTEDDGTEKRVCIDGKQRLTSIQNFIGGIIPHRDPFTNEKLWFTDSKSGPKRKLLPPQYKNLFQNKQIVCIEYSDLPPDFEREVFQRVQMGMALTTAEKMQAITGPWPELVREITKQYYLGKDGLSANMDLDKTRARDFQNLSQTLFCIDQLPDHVQGTTMQVEKWLASQEGPSEAFRTKIHDVFRIYKDLANDRLFKAPFKKPIRVAPAEFIMIGVLIAIHKETLSLSQLSQAIGILRAETRAVHADVRGNAKVFKTMFNVISKKVKPSTLKETPGKPPAGTSTKSGKRKRDESSDEESSKDDNGDGEEEHRPKVAKTQVLPSQLTGRTTANSAAAAMFTAATVPSAPSRIKVEETRPTLPPNRPVQSTSAAPRPPPTGPSRFAKIQAAKAQAANIVNGSGSGQLPPTPISAATSHSSQYGEYPASPRDHPGHQPRKIPNPSLEAAMMGSSDPQMHALQPYPTHPLHASQTYASHPNHTHPVGIPVPISMNGNSSYQLPSPGVSRPAYPTHDGYRRNPSPHSFRDDRSDRGGYRGGRHGYDERRESDSRDNGVERDRGHERDRDYSSSRTSYPTQVEDYYKPRDNGWDRKKAERESREYRRGSGHKER